MASIELLNGNGMFMALLIAGASAMLLFRAQRRLGARQRQQAPSAERQRPRARSGGTSSGNSSSNRAGGGASSTVADNTPGRGSLALRNLADDYEHYQVQLYDMARSLTAELETKASSLRYLAQLADERIALLDQKLTELAEAEQNQPGQVRGVSLETPAGLDSPVGIDNPVGLSSLASYSSPVGSGSPVGIDSPANSDSPAKTARPTTGETSASTAQPGASPSRQQQVQALAASGVAADEIASRLALPIGEVELILALQRRM